MIKKLTRISVLMLAFVPLATSCSDNDDIPEMPAGEKQIQEVLKELDKVEGVDKFVEALKQASSSIAVNLEEEKLTVFAAKNYTATRSSDETLKRHIAKGANDILDFTGDTLKLQTISGEELYVIKTDDGVQVNGVALSENSRINAGESYVYIVADPLPATEIFLESKYTIAFTVLQCNLSWTPESNVETLPSDQAMIMIYTKNSENYIAIDSIRTDAKGYALFKHDYIDQLYYTVNNGDLETNHAGYMPVGVFTSQAEIDANMVVYKTDTPLDDLKPGSIKLADLNGDGLINSDDKLISEYFMADPNDEVTVYLGAGPINWLTPEPILTIEKLREIKTVLNGGFKTFISAYYTMDYKLINDSVSYPQLENLFENETLWSTGYNYIHLYLDVRQKISESSNNRTLLEEWDSYSCDAEYAYIYTTLVNYFGDIPLFTESQTGVPGNYQRNSKAEVMNYIESLVDRASLRNAQVMRVLLARYYANENDYNKVMSSVDPVINLGIYGLVAKPLETISNKEVMLGGYTIGTDSVIAHPVRYREAILLLAEASLKSGNMMRALETVNSIQAANGEAVYSNLTENMLQDVWRREFAGQGMEYMLINRWGILLNVLGKHGAKDFNSLLPIPRNEIILSGIPQNPGYN